jgi:hypothetical protein
VGWLDNEPMMSAVIVVLMIWVGSMPQALANSPPEVPFDGYRFQPPGQMGFEGEDEIIEEYPDVPVADPPPGSSSPFPPGYPQTPPPTAAESRPVVGSSQFRGGDGNNPYRFKIVEGEFYERGERRGRGPRQGPHR